MTEKDTAIRDMNTDPDRQAIQLSERKLIDGQDHIKISRKIIEHMKDNQLDVTGEVQIYYNDDGFVSIGQTTDQEEPHTTVKKGDSEYWIELTDHMDELENIDNYSNRPVILLGCGEIWIMKYNKMWDKIAAVEAYD
jgi:hypothetical protein